MDFRDLKVGDKVFIREDLEDDKFYGAMTYEENMVQGLCEVLEIFYKSKTFSVKTDNGNSWYGYSPEMVDWEKTMNLKINENWGSTKKENSGDGTFEKITQFVENGKEKTVALTNNGEEFAVTNNDEENDIEKAVMMLMLKSIGITYGDVKKEVEKVKVKWMPKKGEKYYWINPYFEINWRIWQELRLDRKLLESGNCFKTEEEAEEKVEKIKEVLKG